jgi:hypothetical protein
VDDPDREVGLDVPAVVRIDVVERGGSGPRLAGAVEARGGVATRMWPRGSVGGSIRRDSASVTSQRPCMEWQSDSPTR